MVQPDAWWIGVIALFVLVAGYSAWYRPSVRSIDDNVRR
jgi:hypothetical protein